MNKVIFFCLIAIISLAFSCGGNKSGQTIPKPEQLKEPLINANQKYTEKESDQINAYVKQHKLDSMQTSGTGLRYMIYKKGSGMMAKNGLLARLSFKISLLDGRECYSSEKSGPKEFLIGHDNVESGLHEGINYLRVGDKALLIIPSHLAFGLVGDEDKIPPKSSVVYDIELLSLRQP